MKKLILILIFTLVLVLGISCQTIQDWTWTKSAGGTGYDMGATVDTDNNGNSYITGSFSGTISFGTTTLISTGTSDAFIAKMDTDGNWLWAKQPTGNSNSNGRNIAVDNDGNCYITGFFEGAMLLGETLLDKEDGYGALFIAKLDTNGNWLWAKQTDGDAFNMSASMSLDNDGNCYLTGCFQSTVIFGTMSLTAIYSVGYNEIGIFITKMDTDGNWLWATKAINTGNLTSNSIAVDQLGNSYVTGSLSINDYSHVHFGSLVINYLGDNAFVAKMDSNGYWLWVQKANITNPDNQWGGSFSGQSIVVDSMGCCYVSGSLYGTADFGQTTLISNNNLGLFISKLDTDGNWLWATQAGGEATIQGNSIALGDDGSLFVAGSFTNGTANFGATTINSSNTWVAFVAKMEPDRSWLWATGTSNNDIDLSFVNCMALDHEGSCYLTGNYAGTVTFGSAVLTSDGSSDIFVAKLSPSSKIAYTPNTILNFYSVYIGSQSALQAIQIKNTGTAPLIISSISYKLSNTPFAVTDLVLPLQIAIGDSATFHMHFTPQHTSLVNDSLFIHSNAHDYPTVAVKLSGRGEIVPPKAPASISINMVNNNAVISWSNVTQTIFDTPFVPDCYIVFISATPEGVFSFIGISHTTSFTHYDTGMYAPYMFYRIKAFKNYSRSIFNMEDYGLKAGMSEEEVDQNLNNDFE